MNSITLHTTFALKTRALTGAEFIIDDSLPAHSASVSGDSTLVVTLANVASGAHTVRIGSFAVRDVYNSPFDTSQRVAFTIPVVQPTRHFYVVSWQFTTSNGVTTAHLTFNAEPSDRALDASHYTLSPYGSVSRVYRDPADRNALYVELSPNVKFVALGKPFVLCVEGIEDAENTPLEVNAADCAGISFAEQDLSNVFVYPNPGKWSDDHVTFARLTPVADIRIYSLGMRPIRHIHTTERQGGVDWDLRDDAGNMVGSGEYLFLVTGTNDAGAAVQSKIQKFVIVRDE
jgi:hypothetical protein